ncbi:hypothetical protein SS50377_25571 [Spironucleus salmonicida]|uniref:Uncharacterized protein n=1 Tax=Spironucleus salmonicida TaxID=348837 RepID=A0A9P8LSM8_9EUKA|nr:hypothetical protein SS50377_25571 [Spironucleus salmonicida]
MHQRNFINSAINNQLNFVNKNHIGWINQQDNRKTNVKRKIIQSLTPFTYTIYYQLEDQLVYILDKYFKAIDFVFHETVTLIDQHNQPFLLIRGQNILNLAVITGNFKIYQILYNFASCNAFIQFPLKHTPLHITANMNCDFQQQLLDSSIMNQYLNIKSEIQDQNPLQIALGRNNFQFFIDITQIHMNQQNKEILIEFLKKTMQVPQLDVLRNIFLQENSEILE